MYERMRACVRARMCARTWLRARARVYTCIQERAHVHGKWPHAQAHIYADTRTNVQVPCTRLCLRTDERVCTVSLVSMQEAAARRRDAAQRLVAARAARDAARSAVAALAA